MFNPQQQLEDYRRVERAILFLEKNFREQPTLDEVASAIGLSPFHFQRLFKRWAGISPKRFLQYLSLEHAKEALRSSEDLLSASFDTGLSGPGRLHDLFVSLEAVTPGEFKAQGLGVRIDWAFCNSPFGTCLLAMTDRGVCHLSFIVNEDKEARLRKLRKNWPKAELREAPDKAASVVSSLFEKREALSGPIHLHVRGTNFQVQVWKALLSIPPGCLWSYQSLARLTGWETGVRAVAGAVGANPVSYLIPCHRVVRKSGRLGGYDGGLIRKRALIGWEAAHRFRATREKEPKDRLRRQLG